MEMPRLNNEMSQHLEVPEVTRSLTLKCVRCSPRSNQCSQYWMLWSTWGPVYSLLPTSKHCALSGIEPLLRPLPRNSEPSSQRSIQPSIARGHW